MRTLARDERGQGLLEYALIFGLIAMVAVGAVLVIGGNVNRTLQDPLGAAAGPSTAGGGAGTTGSAAGGSAGSGSPVTSAIAPGGSAGPTASP